MAHELARIRRHDLLVRSAARKSSCASNLKQLGLANSMYMDDYDAMYLDMGNPRGRGHRLSG